jgi:hypothetical protein
MAEATSPELQPKKKGIAAGVNLLLATALAACGLKARTPSRGAEASEPPSPAAAELGQSRRLDTAQLKEEIDKAKGEARAAALEVSDSEEIKAVAVESGDTLAKIMREDFQGYNIAEIALIPAQVDADHPIERFCGLVSTAEETDKYVMVDGRDGVNFVGYWGLGANLIRPGDTVLAGSREEFRENWELIRSWREGKPSRTYTYWRENIPVVSETAAVLEQYDYLRIDDLPDGERGTQEYYRMKRTPVEKERILERLISGELGTETAVWEEVDTRPVSSEG